MLQLHHKKVVHVTSICKEINHNYEYDKNIFKIQNIEK